ncbi:inhibitor of growth protein 3 isoform X2 [Trichogramma pretiosum]|uniref:Inhibitor of growth protein n=1 Tax=Trichogramma kaykai TaxID=54128 RepID=A0ABD2WFI0_9HYME|nr:inhibitor of growth protein 3 isoform X2 [Trichogramma pretiosum]
MLYLEDYVEMIEHLPQELRDRFTELREMDLSVQNSVDSIEKKVKIFFSNAKKMKADDKDAEYHEIRKEYYKTLEDADEKVNLANQMHDLVDKYLRRLDQELDKFKGELEADNKGITEILEKRSLELDQPSSANISSSQKENRYSFSSTSRARDNHTHARADKRRDSNASTASQDHPKRIAMEKLAVAPSSSQSALCNIPESRPASANSAPLIAQPTAIPATASTPSSAAALANSVGSGSVSYSLGHIGAGGNAIAAAASQAIAATQQMQQGRRTASLKASYEAINTGGVHAAEFSRELAGAAQTAIAAIQESSKKNKKRMTAMSNSNVLSSAVQTQSHTQQTHHHHQHTNHPSQHHAQQHHTHAHQQQHQVQQQQSYLHQQSHHQSLSGNATGGLVNASNQANTNSTTQTTVQVSQAVADVENAEWTFDPNEPRYCICNQVSYGDMVACDNSDCPFEWFHYPCVNITAPPKGKWYCPQCTTSMKRRGSRKN